MYSALQGRQPKSPICSRKLLIMSQSVALRWPLLCTCLYPASLFFLSLGGPFPPVFFPLFSLSLFLLFLRLSLLCRSVRLFLPLHFLSECFSFVLHWVCPSCDHGWIAGGSSKVRRSIIHSILKSAENCRTHRMRGK